MVERWYFQTLLLPPENPHTWTWINGTERCLTWLSTSESYLLWWDVEGDGAHVHVNKAVCARQDEEEPCRITRRQIVETKALPPTNAVRRKLLRKCLKMPGWRKDGRGAKSSSLYQAAAVPTVWQSRGYLQLSWACFRPVIELRCAII